MKLYKFLFVLFIVSVAVYSCKKTPEVLPVTPTPPIAIDTTIVIDTTVIVDTTIIVDTIVVDSPIVVNPARDSLTNASVGSISTSKATATASFSYSGTETLSEEGFVVSIDQNPTTANKKFKADTMRVGNFTSHFKELLPSTTYYARAYAVVGNRTFYSEQVVFTIKSVKLEDAFGGGIIIWLDAAGQHGIIAAKQGIGLQGIWGCKGKSIAGLTAEIGAGKSNTNIIVNACSTDSIAARLCSRLTYNGYSDWYLPSKDELNLLYQHRVATGFNAAERWSSTESGADSAWAQSFETGVAEVVDKATVLGVRPIRYF
ncbi:MAG: DUF1566 domain-containing protein [Ginsengibacter sp.]